MKRNVTGNWKQKIIRLREDYIEVCTFLEYYAQKNKIEKHVFYNNLFKYSLDYLINNGFSYVIEDYESLRKGKGFFLKEDTINYFYETYMFASKYFLKKFRKKLLLAEFTELLIYIYCVNKLSNKEINMLDIDWGIEKISI